MANDPASLRTALARVRGLGASGSGTEHWWRQRLTAASNLPLMLAFLGIMVAATGRDYVGADRLIGHPLAAIVLVLFILSITTHMRLGMMAIIEDYVHDKGLKMAAVMFNTFFTVTIAVAAIFSILKISLGRML